MPDAFDPYEAWLGIPPQDQPPNHYRLLGVRPLEADAGMISAAADARTQHLQSFAAGPGGEIARRLLQEVAASKNFLLNPQKKSVYDSALRAILTAGDQSINNARALGELGQGTAFGEYLLLAKLTEGKSGTVWKAKHRRQNRVVSLRTIRNDGKNPELIKRFQREMSVAANIEHPNLVGAYEAGAQDGVHYLVMEAVEGIDLADIVRQRGPLPVEQAVNYIVQAARGLEHLHGKHIVHRNIKPSNLLLDRSGLVKVSNLVLARIDDAGQHEGGDGEDLTLPGQMMGTADYLPPEQAKDAHAADHRSDIYSLGCTFYCLLTGQPPYPEKSLMKKVLAHRDQPIPSLSASRPEVTPKLERAYQKMMAKDPAARQQNMAEVIADLEGRKAGLPRWLPLAAGVALAATVGIAVLVYLTR